jgi:hypothetical protein
VSRDNEAAAREADCSWHYAARGSDIGALADEAVLYAVLALRVPKGTSYSILRDQVAERSVRAGERIVRLIHGNSVAGEALPRWLALMVDTPADEATVTELQRMIIAGLVMCASDPILGGSQGYS